MRKTVGLLAAVAAVAVGAVAVAVAADSYSVTAKVGSGGTKTKPVAVAAGFTFAGSGEGGVRPSTPKLITFTWDGLRENGGSFPTCTAAKIDAMQSDASCPTGSVVGLGSLKAELGPVGNKTSNANCEKQLKMYNAGAGKVLIYAVGDPTKCAGLSYIPPVPLTWKVKSGKLVLSLPVPDNIAHALPGLEGAFNALQISFKKLSVRKSGKTIGYLSSVGCSSAKRGFVATVSPDDGSASVSSKAVAGNC